jgi:hypothetical protein
MIPITLRFFVVPRVFGHLGHLLLDERIADAVRSEHCCDSCGEPIDDRGGRRERHQHR